MIDHKLNKRLSYTHTLITGTGQHQGAGQGQVVQRTAGPDLAINVASDRRQADTLHERGHRIGLEVEFQVQRLSGRVHRSP
ncbi:hypothetical protein ES708_06175 [subsurface metagenome]